MSKDHVACKIRTAVRADIEQMVSVLAELFEIERDFSPDAAAQRRGLEMMFDKPSATLILIAESEGKLVGMCVLHSRISTFYGAETGVLEDVVVKKEFRGRGVGRLLLHAAERHARGKGWRHLQLLVDRDNRPAEEFYSAHGWRKTKLVCMRRNIEGKD